MGGGNRHSWLLPILILLLFTGCGSYRELPKGEGSPPSWIAGRTVQPGDRVNLILHDGREIGGEIMSMSGDSLRLRTGKRRHPLRHSSGSHQSDVLTLALSEIRRGELVVSTRAPEPLGVAYATLLFATLLWLGSL